MLGRAKAAAIVCVLLLGGVVRDTAAEAAPDFDLDECTWNATHVVVATEGTTIDGQLTVIESWVGSLTPGVELHLPRLAVFAPAAKRKVRERSVVTGARMVLFLKHDAVAQTWTSASPWGHIGESVCWIKDDQAYALSDEANTYTTFIAPLRMTEKAVRARVQQLRAARTALATSRAIEDATQRVAAVVGYADADSPLVVREALDVLKGCGKAAVPFLLSVSDEHAAWRYWHQVYRMLGATGDPTAVPPLVARLEQELLFWQQVRAKLDECWWNGKSMARREARPYKEHVPRVQGPLEALAGVAAPACEDIVRRTRKLWKSTPALRGVGYGCIVKACDEVLQALERRRQGAK